MARRRGITPTPPIPAYLERSVSTTDMGEERRRILEAEGLEPIPARLHALSLGRTQMPAEVTTAKERAAGLAARFAYLTEAVETAYAEGNGQQVVQLRNERDACEIDWWVAERDALAAEVALLRSEAESAVADAKPYHVAFERLHGELIETQRRIEVIRKEADAAENVAGQLLGRAGNLQRDLDRLKVGPQVLTAKRNEGWSAE